MSAPIPAATSSRGSMRVSSAAMDRAATVAAGRAA
jgi:hypothetical protein